MKYQVLISLKIKDKLFKTVVIGNSRVNTDKIYIDSYDMEQQLEQTEP